MHLTTAVPRYGGALGRLALTKILAPSPSAYSIEPSESNYIGTAFSRFLLFSNSPVLVTAIAMVVSPRLIMSPTKNA